MNHHSCVNIDHYEAVGILKAAGNTIQMKIAREVFVDKKRGRVSASTSGHSAVSSPPENATSLSNLTNNSKKSPPPAKRSSLGQISLEKVLHLVLNSNLSILNNLGKISGRNRNPFGKILRQSST